MNLVDRVKNILIAPKQEWPKIDAEAATVQSIFTGYVMILAAIGPVLIIVVTMGAGILVAVGQYVIGLAITYILALIVDALAPSFGGGKDFLKSLKVVAYSWTAVWIVGGIGGVLGSFGRLLGLIALIYAFYTFYVGAPLLGRSSTEKAVVFTIVIVLCGLAMGLVLGMLLMPLMLGTSMMGGMSTLRI